MPRRMKAETWVIKHNGLDLDTRELLERLSSGVNKGAKLQSRASEALDALNAVDEELERLGFNQ